MRRRAKRTRIAGERMELVRMLKAIGVDVPGVSDVSETDDSPSARTPEATGGASQQMNVQSSVGNLGSPPLQ
jgi:hypothetical protein